MESKQERTDVLVLMGGPDAEREVSIQSGREVAAALREKKCLTPFSVIEAVIDAPTAEELAELGGDVVFPVLHGRWGEGGPLQRELESLGKPYVGSGPESSGIAVDKMLTKAILAREGVRTPLAIEIAAGDPCRLPPPLVLKPVDDGSSVDIRICHTPEDVERARAELHPRRARLMAEAFIPGREITVGIVCGRLLPIVEIVPAVDFYDYEAKYDRDDTRYVVDPDLPLAASETLLRDADLAFRRLGCRDVARVDFRLDEDGEAWFLEINTMPGFTTHSLVPLAGRAAGFDMPDLCALLVEAALERPLPAAAPI